MTTPIAKHHSDIILNLCETNLPNRTVYLTVKHHVEELALLARYTYEMEERSQKLTAAICTLKKQLNDKDETIRILSNRLRNYMTKNKT